MKPVSPVFKQTYQNYLSRIKEVDAKPLEVKLGVHADSGAITIPLFGRPYTVYDNKISDPEGKRPSFDICIILCKYILLCPESLSGEKEWTAYRDFKDAGPLTTYFSNDVENAISAYFSGKLNELNTACELLGGRDPHLDVSYDLATTFDLLPRVPLLLLFSDGDEDFPAHCSVLFERRAESFLDAECLAVAGRLLFEKLSTQSPDDI
jgi:hypothetical protein